MEAEISHIGWLGFVPFTIIIGSLFFTILAAILVKPWKLRVTLMVIGSIFLLAVFFVAFLWVGELIAGLFVP
jgi:hypothetical protein